MTEVMERTPLLIASEINSIKEQTRKMVLYNSIEIGRRLAEAKQVVPHGEWGNWLEESVDYSKSTANNLMKIFEQYGADQLTLFGDNAKSQALGELSYTQAVALLGVPVEERETFIKENDIDNMSTRELQQAIKEKQELEKKLKEAEDLAKAERLAKERLEKEHEKLTLQKKKWDSSVDRLKLELEKAQAAGDEKEVERLKTNLEIAISELTDSRERVKNLEKQLKEKPIEVPVVVEKVPEAIEQELEELRKKVATQGTSEAAVKFKVHFESLVSEFKNLLGSLEHIEDQDKYKGAVKGLIDKMLEKL